VATIAGGIVTLVGAGSSVITASEASSNNYEGGSITATLVVNKGNPNVNSFSIPPQTYSLSGSVVLTPPSTNSTGAFTYSSGNTLVAVVSGSSLTITGAGSSQITAFEASDNNYTAGSTTATLTVNQGTPSITNFSIPQLSYSANGTYLITDPSTTSTGAFTYTVSDSNVATVSGKTINIMNVGTTTVTATEASTDNFTSGTSSTSLVIVKANPSFGAFYIAPQTFSADGSYNITPPTSNSTGTITLQSGNTVVATMTGNRAIFGNIGTSIITANQSAVGNYNAGSITATLVINAATPTYGAFNIPTFYYPTTTVYTIVNPTSQSGAAFAYSCDTPSVGYVVGNTLYIQGTGTAIITGSQNAYGNYTYGQFTTAITVYRAFPTITGFTFPSSQIFSSGGSYTITNPSSNSDGAFSYSSGNTQVATITSGNVVSYVGVGTSTITATQAASGNYLSYSVSANFVINRGTAPITFSFTSPVTYSPSASYALSASSNSTGAFTYATANPSVATISGSNYIVQGAGATTITVTEASDNNYTSNTATASLTVGKATPTITFSFTSPVTYSASASYALSASSNSTGAFTYATANPSVATISGSNYIVQGTGATTITVTEASDNNYTSNTATASLTINQATPTIQSYTIADKAYVYGSTFQLTTPTSNSNAAFTYSSNTPSVATVSATGLVTMIGPGQASITISQAATTNYTAASITPTFNISVSQSLTRGNIMNAFSGVAGVAFDISLNGNINTSVVDNVNNITYFGGSFSQVTYGNATSKTTKNLNNVFGFNSVTKAVYAMGVDLSNGTNGNVTAMVLDPFANLYVGGSFVNVYDGSNSAPYVANSVAKWNVSTSSWSLLGNAAGYGVSGSVYTMTYDTSNAAVYLGGNITAVKSTGTAVNNIVKWNVGNNTWSVLGNSTGNGAFTAITQTALSNSVKNVTASFAYATNSWGPLATSYDGKYVMIANGGTSGGAGLAGYIYTSTNYGISGSWIQIFSERKRLWCSVNMSHDGKYQFASEGTRDLSVYIYVSSNYGVSGSWVYSTSPGIVPWNGLDTNLAVSATGQYVATVTNNPGTGIFVSSNYGAFSSWVNVKSDLVTNIPSGQSAAVAMSYSGQIMGFSANNDGILLSSSYGATGTWYQVYPSTGAQGQSLAMSSTGQYMYLGRWVVSNTSILMSTNYGASGSWYSTTVTNTNYGRIAYNQQGVTTSANGQIVALGTSEGAPSAFFVSTNYGASGSFMMVATSNNFYFFSKITPDGKKVYTSTYSFSNQTGNVFSLNIVTPGIFALSLDNSQNLYVGGTLTGYYDSSSALTAANQVAYYNSATNQWSRIGSAASSGVNGTVYAMTYDTSNNLLYVGGNFTDVSDNTNKIYGNAAVWNVAGQTWTPLGNATSNGVNDVVNALQLDISSNKVYVGGRFTSVNDASSHYYATNNIAVWDNCSNLWYPVGLVGNAVGTNGTNGMVNAISYNTIQNTLYVGGTFNQVTDASSTYTVTSMASVTYDPSRNTNYYGRVPYLTWSITDLSLTFLAGGTYTIPTAPTSDSSGTYTYSTNDTAFGTVSGTTLSFSTAVGKAFLYATQTASGYFYGNTIAANLYVNGITPVISNFSVPNQAYVQGNVVVIPPPTTNSPLGGGFTYTSGNTSVLTISGGSMVIQGGGTATISVVQYASGNYAQSNALTSASILVAPQRSINSRFTNLYSPNNMLGGNAMTLNGNVNASAYDPSNNIVYYGGDFTQLTLNATSKNPLLVSYDPKRDFMNFYIDNLNTCVVGNAISGNNYVCTTQLDLSNNLIYVGGNFSTVTDIAGTYSANSIACWNLSTNRWSLLGNATSNGVTRVDPFNYQMYMQLDSSMNLYVGLDGTSFYDASGSITINRIAIWNITTNRWNTLGNAASNGVNNPVYSMTFDKTNNLMYVGGAFNTVTDVSGTLSVGYMAYWNLTTSRWGRLGNATGNGFNNVVRHSIIIDTSLNVYPIGDYTGFYNSSTTLTSSNYIAKYNYSTNTITAVVGPSGGTVKPSYSTYDSSRNRIYSSTATLQYYDISNNIWTPMIISYTSTSNVYTSYDVFTQNLYVTGRVSTLTDLSSIAHTYTGGFKVNTTSYLVKPLAPGFAFNHNGTWGQMIGTPTVNPLTGMVYFGLNTLSANNTILPQYNYSNILGYDISNNSYFPLGQYNAATTPGGTNGTGYFVYALAVDSSSNLYVGGAFGNTFDNSNGNMNTSRIAIWKRTTNTWSPLGGNAASNGVNGTVNVLLFDASQNYLYVGGAMNQGSYNGINTTIGYVGRWNLITPGWSSLGGSYPNTTVTTLAWGLSNNLYIGGAFTSVNTTPSRTANRIAVWNATTNIWGNVGNATSTAQANNTVYALSVDTSNNMLYVGGVFTSVTDTAARAYPYISKWDISNSLWSPLGNVTSNGTNGRVNSTVIDISNQLLYVGGTFTYVSDNSYTNWPINNIAAYDAKSNGWQPIGNISYNGTGGTSGTVNTITRNQINGNIYIGGNFTTISDTLYGAINASKITSIFTNSFFESTIVSDIYGTVPGYNLYVFTQTSRSYPISYNAKTATQIYALVVAGGGGAGSSIAGGAGGGGVVMTPITIPAGSDTMTINVGAGGITPNSTTGGAMDAGRLPGVNGNNSTITFTNNTVSNLTATGGGLSRTEGLSSTGIPGNGGSGGGAVNYVAPGQVSNILGNYSSSVFYGNAGGTNYDWPRPGGGGGAGAPGGNATAALPGNGGIGIKCTLPGISSFAPYKDYYFGSGGGAGSYGNGGYAGSYTGGGTASTYNFVGGYATTSGQNAANNTGGGGGGAGMSPQNRVWPSGGSGGSGIVILAVPQF